MLTKKNNNLNDYYQHHNHHSHHHENIKSDILNDMDEDFSSLLNDNKPLNIYYVYSI